MFQNSLNKLNVLVLLLLLASLAMAYFSPFTEGSILHTIQSAAGAFALLFPVGWIMLSAVFPKKEELSMLARLLLSVFLSIAANSLSLVAISYLFPQFPLSASLNILVLLFFGVLFFAAAILRGEA